MKFRDDIPLESTWVTTDTHFGHDNIVGFCHRPLDHEQVMLAEWRKEVPDDATLLHLGDLAYRDNARFRHVVAPELTGANKKIVLGNHDKQRPNFYRQCGFQVCRPFAIQVIAEGLSPYTGLHLKQPDDYGWNYTISFSHYPWNEAEDGEQQETDWRLHGHIHNNGYSRDEFVPFLKNHINLSVEQTKYRPVNLKLLLEAALLGVYPETTQEQQDEAFERKQRARAEGEKR